MQLSQMVIEHGPETIGEAPYCFRRFISSERIQNEVRRLGQELSRDFAGRDPVLIGVLNGCFLFMADLSRELRVEVSIDFVKLSSYRDGMQAGRLNLDKNVGLDIAGRHVILVEDIVDTGNSLDFLRTHIRGLGVASLSMVAMFVKESAIRLNRQPEYTGLVIPDDFVVGYGLDHGGRWRQLADLYVLIPHEDQA
ncbi:hypoxanthine phosphoribosyltransferase [candidate division KSB1 bacterium]|nr:hypoxanthine phosphoribosyltransferase [candidate division KSB1 bacterium]